MEFDRFHAKKVTQVAAGALAAAGVIMPLTWAAAPFIGGATGALTGLSGAAATSHGLAMWGFGSLAAGGLGMAGGSMVITAVGTALGGALGAATTTAYVGTDDSFKIEQLRDGVGNPVLLANGFLGERTKKWGPWRRMIDDRYPDNPVYRVTWGASENDTLAKFSAVGGIAGLAGKGFAERALRAAKSASFGNLGAALAVAGVAKNPWHVARNRAIMTGAVLADLIARTESEPFILVGHSLGALVMATAAETLETRPGTSKVHSMHLLGAAISTKRDWRLIHTVVLEKCWIYFSKRDAVLANLYKIAQVGDNAVGLRGAKSAFANIVDRNVSTQVDCHSSYFSKASLAK